MFPLRAFQTGLSLRASLPSAFMACESPRTISLSHPCLKYKFQPSVKAPEEPEYFEPGRAKEEEESLIQILTLKQYKEGFKRWKEEFKLWSKDRKDEIQDNYDLLIASDQIHKIHSFADDNTIKEWTTLCDAAEGGESSCEFTQSATGSAIFSGILSTKVPQDGKTYRSGFCTTVGPRAMERFNRKGHYEWSQFTHLVLKVRGDGRQYFVNISTEGDYDLNWYNMYSYPLYTRGGPYWQLTKIPFSKFIFGARGYIQDTQVPIPLTDVAWLGIALTDDIDGPFKLEIEYIGLEEMTSHDEEHAYETYNFDSYLKE